MAGNSGQSLRAEGLSSTTQESEFYHQPVSVEDLNTQMTLQSQPMLRLQSCGNLSK